MECKIQVSGSERPRGGQGSLAPVSAMRLAWVGVAVLGLRWHLSGCAEKLDEILAVAAEPTLRPDIADADSRAATVKQRPTSRRITPAEISVSQPWARALGWSGPGLGIRGSCTSLLR